MSEYFEWATEREGGHDLFDLGNHRTEGSRETMRTMADEMGVKAEAVW